MSPLGKLRLLIIAGLLLGGAPAGFGAPASSAGSDAPAADASASIPDKTCLECHRNPALVVRREGTDVKLTVSADEIAASVHSGQACVDCHEGLNPRAKPHQVPLRTVNCIGCHDDIAKAHAFHPDFAATPFRDTAQTGCVDCHGGHGIQAASGRTSAFAGAKVTVLCAQCHDEAAQHFNESAHGTALAAGNQEAPTCLVCHKAGAMTADTGLPGGLLATKRARSRLCLSCHLDNPKVLAASLLGHRFIASYSMSAHGKALTRGKAEAADCVDCHGSHEMNRAMVSSSRVNPQNIPLTCAKCHPKEAREYAVSVHAAALTKGNADSPVCTTCHGEHGILLHDDPNAPVSSRNVSQMVCGSCHASVKLNQRYGMATDRVQTFADSYHGLATRGGSVVAVNCTSCHGAHGVRPSADPLSPINKANLARTCGQCHPGANAKFSQGSVHVSQTAGSEEPVVYWVATVYVWLIVCVVGSMAFHNGLDFLKKVRRKIAIQKGEIVEEPLPHRLYLRMTVNERLQHATLVMSFAVLVVTGFMLRFPDAFWVVYLRTQSDHLFEWRGRVHRLAAVAMTVAGIWHVLYLATTVRGRRLFLDLLPRRRDAEDLGGMLRYNFGLRPDRPRLGRFSYIEKAEYWALLWGTLIMGVTGAFLWFENKAIGLFTKVGYDVSRTVHFYEAVLATLAIIVWHLYFVIFNPDVYPMNLSWLTGRLSEKEMHDDHPLELEAIRAERVDEAEAALPLKDGPAGAAGAAAPAGSGGVRDRGGEAAGGPAQGAGPGAPAQGTEPGSGAAPAPGPDREPPRPDGGKSGDGSAGKSG